MVSLYAKSTPRDRIGMMDIALAVSFLAICPLALIVFAVGLISAYSGGLAPTAATFLGLGVTCVLVQFSLLFFLFVPWQRRGQAVASGAGTSALLLGCLGFLTAAQTIDELDPLLTVMFLSWALPALYLNISGLRRLS